MCHEIANFTASLIIWRCKIINELAPCCIKRHANGLCFFAVAATAGDGDGCSSGAFDDEFELRLPLVTDDEMTAFAKKRTAPYP